MTSKKYAERGGLQCPRCYSYKIASQGRYESSGDYNVKIKLRCWNCGTDWTEHYELISIEIEGQDGK